MVEQLINFNKILYNLEIIEVNLKDEDWSLLLSVLPICLRCFVKQQTVTFGGGSN